MSKLKHSHQSRATSDLPYCLPSGHYDSTHSQSQFSVREQPLHTSPTKHHLNRQSNTASKRPEMGLACGLTYAWSFARQLLGLSLAPIQRQRMNTQSSHLLGNKKQNLWILDIISTISNCII